VIPFHLKIRIDGLPRMANGSYGSWQRNAAEKKKWKMLMARELAGLAPQVPFTRMRATFTRCSSVEPDDDGLTHGFKPVRDALVRLGFVIDDKRTNLEAVYRWEKVPQGQGHIQVEIEGLEP
jgi:hypothetical protein